MNTNDKIYELQLWLKQNKVDQKRKKHEVKTLFNSYEKQIKDLIHNLYDFSNHLWFHLNEKSFDYLNNIPNDVNNCENTQEITLKLASFRGSLNHFVSSNFVDDPYLPRRFFVLVLSLFGFLWSKESADLFCEFLIQLEIKLLPKYAQCLLVNPLVQIYFISVLRPIFDKISNENENEESLFKLVLDLLSQYQPLLPDFFKKLLLQSSSRSYLFYDIFLKSFITNFSIFCIFDPCMLAFHQDKINKLVNKLDEYFATEQTNDFVLSLINKSESISIIPMEEKFIKIYKHYIPSTIIEKNIIEFVQSNNTDPKQFFSSNEVIDELVYIPLSSHASVSTISPTTFQSDSALNIACRILLASNLIHIDRQIANAYEYLDLLADISFSNGNPVVESELEKFQNIASNLTLNELCTMIDNKINILQISNGDDQLQNISQYSSQFSQMNRLIEILNNQINSSKTTINFYGIQKIVSMFIEENAPPENIADSEVFISYFINASKYIQDNSTIPIGQNNIISNSNLHSFLISRLDLLNKLQKDPSVIEKDQQMHEFITKYMQDLIDYNKHYFLDQYKKDPELLKFVMKDFETAFTSDIPNVRLTHIHAAYQSLSVLLQIQGLNEIGADQIIPFAMLATIYANPLNLASTYEFFARYFEPVNKDYHFIESSNEYSLIQFMSTFQFLRQKMNDVLIGKALDSNDVQNQ